MLTRRTVSTKLTALQGGNSSLVRHKRQRGGVRTGRTVHSLIETLCRFGNVNFVLISPDELKTPQYVLDRINATESCSYTEVKDMVSVIRDLDVLYITHVTKEHFFNEDEYMRLRDNNITREASVDCA